MNELYKIAEFYEKSGNKIEVYYDSDTDENLNIYVNINVERPTAEYKSNQKNKGYVARTEEYLP